MGKIGDFFRKKGKEELKKEEKKIAKKYKGNYTREELKEKAVSSVLRKTILKGGIALSCIAAGVVGYNISNSQKDEIVDNNATSEIKELVQNYDDISDKTEDISSKIDEISTKKEALDFVKEMYVNEYNKENNTEYSLDDIYFSSGSPQDYVYDVDGLYVTHSETPDEVRKKLESENRNYDIKRNVKIYRSYVLDGDKKILLEKFALSDAKTVNVVLGEEYLNSNELDINENNTLLNMYDIIVKGSDLVVAYNNGENDGSISLRKNYLENAVENFNKNQKEINEIGGI